MIFAFDDFELDTRLFELRRDGEPCPVEPQVFDVLRHLLENRDRVVSKEELFHEVWGDRIVTESALSSRLKAARQAIGDSGTEQRLIKTLHGRGYRFVGQVVQRGVPVAVEAPEPASVEPAVIAELTPVEAIGRAAELRRLSAAFASARGGSRQIVFITGEAGLGKTTLVGDFIRGLQGPAAPIVLTGHCLEHHGQGEAYLPLLEALARLAKTPDAAERVDVLRQHAPSWLIELPALVGAEERTALRELSRGVTRDRMLRELVEALEELTRTDSLLFVLEDLHWSDPSTVDFLAWLANRQEPARLMVLGTYRAQDARSEQHPIDVVAERLKIRGLAQEIRLDYLDETSTRQFLERRLPGAEIPADLVALVHTRTDGNPLFMGSVIDHWVAREQVRSEEGAWQILADLEDLCGEVPESLRLLIERRLADLPTPELELLEAASVVGTEFPASLVAAAGAKTEDETENICAQLAREGGLIEACGAFAWPDGTASARFRFVHDLFQQVLYQRVPPGRRARLHAVIGTRLEASLSFSARDRAAELATHFVKGGERRKAVDFYLKAAQQALRRLAQAEACQHLRTGLEILNSLPADSWRDETELHYQSALAPTLMLVEGFGSLDAEAAFSRARELCEILDNPNQLSAVIYGMAIQFELRGEFKRSQTLMEERIELLDISPETPHLEAETYDLLACSHFHQAHYAHALRFAEAGIELLDTSGHSPAASSLGESPAIGCHGWAGLSLWFMGQPDRALEVARKAVELSRLPGRTYSLSNSKMQVALVCQLRRETGPTRVWANETIASARSDGFAMRAAIGQLYRAWADVIEQQTDAAIPSMRAELEALEQIGLRLDRPYFLGLYSEALAMVGRTEEALQAVNEALGSIEQPQSHFFEAELHRLAGEILLKQGNSDRNSAEERYRHALELARSQGGRSIELRAAMSLTRLWQEEGHGEDGLEILGPILDSFSEGFDTPDLVDARELVTATSPPQRTQATRKASARKRRSTSRPK